MVEERPLVYTSGKIKHEVDQWEYYENINNNPPDEKTNKLGEYVMIW